MSAFTSLISVAVYSYLLVSACAFGSCPPTHKNRSGGSSSTQCGTVLLRMTRRQTRLWPLVVVIAPSTRRNLHPAGGGGPGSDAINGDVVCAQPSSSEPCLLNNVNRRRRTWRRRCLGSCGGCCWRRRRRGASSAAAPSASSPSTRRRRGWFRDYILDSVLVTCLQHVHGWTCSPGSLVC